MSGGLNGASRTSRNDSECSAKPVESSKTFLSPPPNRSCPHCSCLAWPALLGSLILCLGWLGLCQAMSAQAGWAGWGWLWICQAGLAGPDPVEKQEK